MFWVTKTSSMLVPMLCAMQVTTSSQSNLLLDWIIAFMQATVDIGCPQADNLISHQSHAQFCAGLQVISQCNLLETLIMYWHESFHADGICFAWFKPSGMVPFPSIIRVNTPVIAWKPDWLNQNLNQDWPISSLWVCSN